MSKNANQVSESAFEYLLLGIISEYTKDMGGRQGSEAALLKLDSIGSRIGERLVERDTKDKSRFQDPLEAVKYVCKDIWGIICKKNVSSLKTNRGIRMMFVITDTQFKWLSHISAPRQSPIDTPFPQNQSQIQPNETSTPTTSSSTSTVSPQQQQQQLQQREVYAPYTALFCGIIRGTLSALGIEVTVTSEVMQTSPPGVTFTARTVAQYPPPTPSSSQSQQSQISSPQTDTLQQQKQSNQ